MTILCVNCGAPAVWHQADPGVNPVDYCDFCLPSQFRHRATAGHLQNSQEVDPAARAAAAEQFGDLQAAIQARFPDTDPNTEPDPQAPAATPKPPKRTRG